MVRMSPPKLVLGKHHKGPQPPRLAGPMATVRLSSPRRAWPPHSPLVVTLLCTHPGCPPSRPGPCPVGTDGTASGLCAPHPETRLLSLFPYVDLLCPKTRDEP